MNPVGAFQFSVFFVKRPPNGLASPTDGLVTLSAGSVGATLRVRCAEVQGIDAGLEVETYREGGRNTNPLRFPRWGQFANLVLRRGITDDTALWDWYFQVLFATQAPERRNGFVLLQATSAQTALPGIGGQPVAAWFFSNALPERLTGPALNARSNEVAVESLEVAHEGLLRLTPSLIPGLVAFAAARSD
jgi:phage tail-like protein